MSIDTILARVPQPFSKSDAVRFLEKIKVDESCWYWNSAKNQRGYGKFSVKNKAKSAHRISYCLFRGPIPEGIGVLHTCDNPWCVNPKHFFLGTNADNTADMMRKGRHSSGVAHSIKNRGELHARSKLTELKVVEIRNTWSSGCETQTQLAKRYGVSVSTIERIVHRKIWTFVN